MRREYPLPPSGGLCVGADPKHFVDATTEVEIQQGIAICNICPVLEACHKWAEETVAEYNRDVTPDKGQRVNIRGVVGARYYVPTDYRGAKL